MVIPTWQLVRAYRSGFFPMADPDTGELNWYTADPRAVLPLYPYHVPARLHRTIRSRGFRFSLDQRFEEVMRACGDRESSWINEDLIASYLEFHHQGFAHSVETWQDDQLVGGLYGVHVAGAFFGESVFHRVPDAGKAAMAHLLQHLSARGFRMLEIQMVTNLTCQFQPEMITRVEYRRRLAHALRNPVSFLPDSTATTESPEIRATMTADEDQP